MNKVKKKKNLPIGGQDCSPTKFRQGGQIVDLTAKCVSEVFLEFPSEGDSQDIIDPKIFKN